MADYRIDTSQVKSLAATLASINSCLVPPLTSATATECGYSAADVAISSAQTWCISRTENISTIVITSANGAVSAATSYEVVDNKAIRHGANR